MKSCPTCNRTYPDDTLAFCLMDGSVLSAPYDPAAKPTRDADPPPTEVLPAPNVAAHQELTLQSTRPETQPQRSHQLNSKTQGLKLNRETRNRSERNIPFSIVLAFCVVMASLCIALSFVIWNPMPLLVAAIFGLIAGLSWLVNSRSA